MTSRTRVARPAGIRDDESGAFLTDDGRDRSSEEEPDSLLRAIAAAPERAQQAMPARVAHFRVLGLLGRGGMGVVYRAHDDTLRREIALKLLTESGVDDERRQRFLREARSAAAISHPNVAAVHQVGEADGSAYIAMELVDGESLRARLDRGPLGAGDAMDLATQVARGLGAAHERQLVHRDLKPENVMITREGVVKLLDFGLAKPARAGARAADGEVGASATEMLVTAEAGRVMGTPPYMSPEQAIGAPLDARSDVFSFGILLYEMLSGTRPFSGTSSGALLVAIARDPVPSLRARVPDVDAKMEAIVERCLAKAPEERFASAVEIVAALSAASPPKKEGAARTRAVGAWSGLLAAGSLGAIALIAATTGSWPRGASTGPAASHAVSVPPAPSSSVTRIVDLPAPKTDVPAAATEYAAGIQAIHDNTWMIAVAHFFKAVTLDPSMPEAHLRLSMMMLPVRDAATRRSEFEKAAGLRGRLGERDQALLEAMQPFLQARLQDVAEADKRLRALAERYPTDAEIWMWLAAIHYFTPEMRGPGERMLALDPNDPVGWEVKADLAVLEGKIDEAHADFERCSAHSIDGAECFAIMSWGDRAAGRCMDFEHAARRAADRAPFWLNLLIPARARNGATAQELEETATQFVSALPPPMAPEIQRLGLESRLAFLAGDFTRANAMAKEEAAALAADPAHRAIYWIQHQATTHLLDVALETGDTASAQRIAADFVARSDAWSGEAFLGHGVDLSLYFARVALPPDRPPPPAFEIQRRAWIEQRLASGASRGSMMWTYAYALPALTAAEAKAAIEALPENAPRAVPSFGGWGFSGRVGSPDASAGHVYLLAGQLDDAIVHLRRAADACDVYDSTLDHVRASLDLGRALEEKGDRDGACAAYRSVLARWGQAKPRSVTADAARERTAHLRCGAP